jgi:hypothetical protein
VTGAVKAAAPVAVEIKAAGLVVVAKAAVKAASLVVVAEAAARAAAHSVALAVTVVPAVVPARAVAQRGAGDGYGRNQSPPATRRQLSANKNWSRAYRAAAPEAPTDLARMRRQWSTRCRCRWSK